MDATGVYRVRHAGPHRAAHEISLLEGATLPPCEVCGDEVRFELEHAVKHIFDDEDFRHARGRTTKSPFRLVPRRRV